MINNLKTIVRAYPKLSPSMIDNFATKNDLDSYVTKSEFYDTTQSFVKDVVDPIPEVIYGRSEGEWVRIPQIEKEDI